jgi:hypothetical protein
MTFSLPFSLLSLLSFLSFVFAFNLGLLRFLSFMLLSAVVFGSLVFTFLLLVGLGVLLGFFNLSVDMLVQLFVFSLLVLLLGLFGSFHFCGLSLPLDHLFSDDVDGFRVFNAGSNVIPEFFRIALAIEVGVEKDSKIPVSHRDYSSFSLSKVSLCLTPRVLMNNSMMKVLSLIYKS